MIGAWDGLQKILRAEGSSDEDEAPQAPGPPRLSASQRRPIGVPEESHSHTNWHLTGNEPVNWQVARFRSCTVPYAV